MNFEEKRALLKKYQALQADIEILSEMRMRLMSVRELSPKGNGNGGSFTKGYKQDKIQELTERLCEIDKKIVKKSRVQGKLCKTVVVAIARLADERERRAIYLHYIKLLPVYKVALEMNYSERRISDFIKSGIENMKI